MNYKSAGSYSRELEHWVEGGNVLGYNTGGEDSLSSTTVQSATCAFEVQTSTYCSLLTNT